MASLVQGNLNQLEISPNLWAGIGLVRSGAGTALVGDASTLAQRMLEYADLGIESASQAWRTVSADCSPHCSQA